MYEIQDSLNSYTEVIQTLPKLDQLRDLLVETAFRGPDEDEDVSRPLVMEHLRGTDRSARSRWMKGHCTPNNSLWK